MGDGRTMNVLVTSLSKKISLVKMVRKGLDHIGGGLVIGGDSDPHCIGRYFVDDFWQMPRFEELTPEMLATICQEKKISSLIPTRDAELPFFAKHREWFAQKGIHVMVSPLKTVELCRDKLDFYQTFKRDFPVIPSSLALEQVEGEKIVVKERFGSGSRFILLDAPRKEAYEYAEKLQNPLFQPFIQGQEISVDLYVRKDGQMQGVVLRRRERIEGGESQITTTFRDIGLEELFVKIAELLGIYGHAVMQGLITEQGLWILECNPRFGGASRLSCEVGLETFTWFFRESRDEPLAPFLRNPEEKRLVRYPEDLIL
jgi:carbamoyl-phosphate synthase large subunit